MIFLPLRRRGSRMLLPNVESEVHLNARTSTTFSISSLNTSVLKVSINAHAHLQYKSCEIHVCYARNLHLGNIVIFESNYIICSDAYTENDFSTYHFSRGIEIK